MNKAIIIGRLGSDPETRVTQNGTSVANMSVATSSRWTDKNGEKNESTEWHRIVVWDRLADLCAEYLKKGSQVAVEGSIQTRQWEDRDGNTRYTTEIRATNVEFLSSKSDGGDGGQKSSEASQRTPEPLSDDDIPF